jgi:hypothetical protein
MKCQEHSEKQDEECLTCSNARIRELELQNEGLLKILRELEWQMDLELRMKYCPTCENNQNTGHLPACVLAAVLQSTPLKPFQGPQIPLPDGTAPPDQTLPSFTSDTNTGRYRDASGEIRFVKDGVVQKPVDACTTEGRPMNEMIPPIENPPYGLR